MIVLPISKRAWCLEEFRVEFQTCMVLLTVARFGVPVVWVPSDLHGTSHRRPSWCCCLRSELSSGHAWFSNKFQGPCIVWVPSYLHGTFHRQPCCCCCLSSSWVPDMHGSLTVARFEVPVVWVPSDLHGTSHRQSCWCSCLSSDLSSGHAWLCNSNTLQGPFIVKSSQLLAWDLPSSILLVLLLEFRVEFWTCIVL